MSAARQRPAQPGPVLSSRSDELQQRLEACTRLIEIVAAQVAAVAANDTTRASLLQFDRVFAEQSLLGVEPDFGPHGAFDPGIEVSLVLQDAFDFVEGRSEDEQRLRDWADVVQAASLPLLKRQGTWLRRVAQPA